MQVVVVMMLIMMMSKLYFVGFSRFSPSFEGEYYYGVLVKERQRSRIGVGMPFGFGCVFIDKHQLINLAKCKTMGRREREREREQ